jgi:hypothetical protein
VVVQGLVHGVRAGSGGALVRGEPGVGKTARLRATRDACEGVRVLSARGIESEVEIPFAGLGELLRPILSTLDLLPDGGRREAGDRGPDFGQVVDAQSPARPDLLDDCVGAADANDACLLEARHAAQHPWPRLRLG